MHTVQMCYVLSTENNYTCHLSNNVVAIDSSKFHTRWYWERLETSITHFCTDLTLQIANDSHCHYKKNRIYVAEVGWPANTLNAKVLVPNIWRECTICNPYVIICITILIPSIINMEFLYQYLSNITILLT